MNILRRCQKIFSHALALVLGICLMVGLAPSVALAATTTTDLTVGKTVSETELTDTQRTTRVTLSVPAVEAQSTNDIVFVVDSSDCSFASVPKLIEMLRELYAAEQTSSMTNHVGIVFFRGNAARASELSELTEERINQIETYYNSTSSNSTVYENKLTEWIVEKHPDYISRGSNLDAGLTEAKKMLDEDTSTSADHKYVITITDGLTYEFVDDDGTAKSVYQATSATGANNLLYVWCAKWGIDASGTWEAPANFTWEDYYATISEQVAADGDTYVASLSALRDYIGSSHDYRVVSLDELAALGYQAIPAGEYASHAVSDDRAAYESYQTWEAMVDEGYLCYYIQPVSSFTDTSFPTIFANAMNEASGNTDDIDFEKITNQIIYAVLAGTITDEIGDDFDLVTDGDTCPFTLTVHDEELTATQTGENQWSFGTAVNGVYPYVLDYTPDDEETGAGETIVLSSETPLERSSQLTLSYDVSLKESSTASLTERTTFDTNEYAVLEYVDSTGNQYSEEFPVPQVNYTPTVVSEETESTEAAQPTPDENKTVMPDTGDGLEKPMPLALLAIGGGFAIAAVIISRRKESE